MWTWCSRRNLPGTWRRRLEIIPSSLAHGGELLVSPLETQCAARHAVSGIPGTSRSSQLSGQGHTLSGQPLAKDSRAGIQELTMTGHLALLYGQSLGAGWDSQSCTASWWSSCSIQLPSPFFHLCETSIMGGSLSLPTFAFSPSLFFLIWVTSNTLLHFHFLMFTFGSCFPET